MPAVGAGSLGLWLMGRPQSLAAGGLLAVLGFGFAGFCCYFFRDPERLTPADGRVYAPGEGRVMSVAREGPGEGLTVRIFLSIFDVHIQRAPCAGRVTKVQVVEGAFAAAMKDAARFNARVVMTLEPEGRPGPIVVEQIAGLIARRIECWPSVGETLAAGQRYGIIYFGSQAAVHLPSGCRPLVKPGDRVFAGASPIAEWTSKP